MPIKTADIGRYYRKSVIRTFNERSLVHLKSPLNVKNLLYEMSMTCSFEENHKMSEKTGNKVQRLRDWFRM